MKHNNIIENVKIALGAAYIFIVLTCGESLVNLLIGA